MFIIGKDIKNCDNTLRMIIGDKNIVLINDYFNNFFAVCYNDQDLKIKNEIVTNLEKRLLSSCYDGIGFYPFINLVKLDSVGNSLDIAKEQANEARKKLKLSLKKIDNNNQDIKDSNIFDKLEKTHFLHSIYKFMGDNTVEITEDDLLLDLVLNNELDLIQDFFNDYRSLNFDVRLAQKQGKANINHNFYDLDLRFQNIVFQNEMLNIYKNSNQDASLINVVITESYGLLKKGLTEDLTESELDDYRDKFNFNIEDEKELDIAIKKYVNATLDSILMCRKNTNNKKKAK